MPEMDSRRLVTTRKPHDCFFCGSLIEAGARVIKFAVVVDVWNGFRAGYGCGVCADSKFLYAGQEGNGNG